jgi:hypothetical protein
MTTLNLPILDRLADSQSILIAGAGGGFDVFAGLPIYFTLRALGKTVHLANYSFTEFGLLKVIAEPEVLIETLLVGARGAVKVNFMYYPEGYLAQWFRDVRGENVTVWMFAKTGAVPLAMCYETLVKQLGIDAIILVDGGVDSLMRGDEMGAGTLLEDSLTLAAVDAVNVPVKILACVGFGTEVEEAVCHYHALENMAALIKAGAFLGGCALTPQMDAFALYEQACRYVWEQPDHHKSHISTRIIPAVRGEFGNYRMYDGDHDLASSLVSPLMSLYWFFDAPAVVRRSLIIDALRDTYSFHEAIDKITRLRRALPMRPRHNLPY